MHVFIDADNISSRCDLTPMLMILDSIQHIYIAGNDHGTHVQRWKDHLKLSCIPDSLITSVVLQSVYQAADVHLIIWMARISAAWQEPEPIYLFSGDKLIIAAARSISSKLIVVGMTDNHMKIAEEFNIPFLKLTKQNEMGVLTRSIIIPQTEKPLPKNVKQPNIIWDWFIGFLAKPNTVNGRDKRFRAGFKAQDGQIFLNEVAVRRAMAADHYNDPSMAEAKKGDGRSTIIETLLQILDQKKVLVKTFNDDTFSYKNALFRAESRDKNGKVVGEWAACFVVDLAELMPKSVAELAPAPNPPRITSAIYQQRALKAVTVSSQSSEEVEEGEGCGDDDPFAPMSTVKDEVASSISMDSFVFNPNVLEVEPEISSQPSSETGVIKEKVDTKQVLMKSNNDLQSFCFESDGLSKMSTLSERKGSKKSNKNNARRRSVSEVSEEAKAISANLNKNSAFKKDEVALQNNEKLPAITNKSDDIFVELKYNSISLHCNGECLGSLTIAILKGLEQNKELIKEETEEKIVMTVKQASQAALLGGINVYDLTAFLKAIGDNKKVLNGLFFDLNSSDGVEFVWITKNSN